MLEKQSVNWITDKNTDVNVNKNLEAILPPTIISHVDYYKRLQDRAIFIETGNTALLDETQNKTELLKFKNATLGSIYHELKEAIRHVTYTPEHSVYSIYLDYMTRLKNNLVSY